MAKTVLIIDDVPANVGVLLDVLAAAGFEMAVAESGESALEQLAWLRPDIILLEMLMPGLDGFETCRRLKALEATADVPVLFMTALTDVVDKVRGFAAGAVDYLAKPLHPEEVLALNAHLRLREHLRLLAQRADELDREIQRRIQAAREVERVLEHGLIVMGAGDRILFVSARPLAIHLDEVPPPPSPALLAPLGLAPRETEILFWIAQGKNERRDRRHPRRRAGDGEEARGKHPAQARRRDAAGRRAAGDGTAERRGGGSRVRGSGKALMEEARCAGGSGAGDPSRRDAGGQTASRWRRSVGTPAMRWMGRARRVA